MNNHFIHLLLFFVMPLCMCSCSMPNGVSIGPVDDNGQKTITLQFDKVTLKFDWSKKLNTAFVVGDYGEFIAAHNVANCDWSKYSGTIDNLGNILWDVDSYDESHRPSISVTIEDVFYGKTVHQCNKEDISWNTVFGIPKIDNFYQGTVEIKSIKTRDNGVQVVWKKSALKDNWPINEFVKDGSISCENTAITKVGTNNDSGNVAARGNTIISNTSDKDIKEDARFTIDEKQLLSPDLCKPVLINGGVSENVKWSKPVIYKTL